MLYTEIRTPTPSHFRRLRKEVQERTGVKGQEKVLRRLPGKSVANESIRKVGLERNKTSKQCTIPNVDPVRCSHRTLGDKNAQNESKFVFRSFEAKYWIINQIKKPPLHGFKNYAVVWDWKWPPLKVHPISSSKHVASSLEVYPISPITGSSASGAKALRITLISTHDSFLLLYSILALHVSIYVSVTYTYFVTSKWTADDVP
jgi:hypothetical protein